MKIRHKQSGVELEGFFTCMTDGRRHPAQSYFFSNTTGSQYMMSEWEEVKPQWVDVSAECGLSRESDSEGVGFQHRPGKDDRNTLFVWPRLADLEGYRLRKIKVDRDMNGAWCINRDAFIIEQRQS